MFDITVDLSSEDNILRVTEYSVCIEAIFQAEKTLQKNLKTLQVKVNCK